MKSSGWKFRWTCAALMGFGLIGSPLTALAQEPGTDASQESQAEQEQAEALEQVAELQETINRLQAELLERQRDLQGAQRRIQLDRAAAQQAQALRALEAARLNEKMQELFMVAPDAQQLWIGVTTEALSEEKADELGLEEGQTGVVVIGVVPESPAASAGLQENDVIVSVGETAIDDVAKLVKIVLASDGAPLEVQLIREGEEQVVEVTPAERPAEFAIGRAARLELSDGVEVFSNESLTPDNISVSIARNGDEPAVIKVVYDGESYEVTSESIDMLPEEIQAPVRRAVEGLNGGPLQILRGDDVNRDLLNLMPLGMRLLLEGESNSFQVFPPGALGDLGPLQPAGEELLSGESEEGELPSALREELDELNAEMTEIKRLLERLLEERD